VPPDEFGERGLIAIGKEGREKFPVGAGFGQQR
jgi:hypothetical protein